MNIQNLVLDINKKPFQIITANTGEVASRFIRVNIVDGATPMNLTGITASIYAEKPDGKKVFNNVLCFLKLLFLIIVILDRYGIIFLLCHLIVLYY